MEAETHQGNDQTPCFIRKQIIICDSRVKTNPPTNTEWGPLLSTALNIWSVVASKFGVLCYLLQQSVLWVDDDE